MELYENDAAHILKQVAHKTPGSSRLGLEASLDSLRLAPPSNDNVRFSTVYLSQISRGRISSSVRSGPGRCVRRACVNNTHTRPNTFHAPYSDARARARLSSI